MKAIRVHAAGGPEALSYEDVPDPKAGDGQAVVKVEAIGLNFAEINARKNANTANGPVGIGGEAAGTIVDVGPGVQGFKAGDRVAFNGVPGAYAELVAAPAERLVPVPASLTSKQAAAVLLQGMTAHYLACTTYPLKSGDSCLVHAAAGGVGVLLCQMAHNRGARVIGTVSTEAKTKVASDCGADDVVLYSQVDFEDEVKKLTGGSGVNVVYDSVGKTTFTKGFGCLRPRGMMVLYGQSSGPIEAFDASVLQRGSLFFTRTGLANYTLTRDELMQRSGEVFGWVADGSLKLHIHAEFPLKDASKAQAAMEQRETVGKVLLIP
jgi:NADPH2:quinone reductase